MTVKVWSRFWGWSLVEISMLNIGQDFEAGLWSTFDKTLGSFLGETKNRSDRKGDLCCSALLKPTLEPKRLLHFNFFTGLKFFWSQMKFVYFALVLRKPLFNCNCKKCSHGEKSLFIFLCSKFVSPWVFVPAFAKL